MIFLETSVIDLCHHGRLDLEGNSSFDSSLIVTKAGADFDRYDASFMRRLLLKVFESDNFFWRPLFLNDNFFSRPLVLSDLEDLDLEFGRSFSDFVFRSTSEGLGHFNVASKGKESSSPIDAERVEREDVEKEDDRARWSLKLLQLLDLPPLLFIKLRELIFRSTIVAIYYHECCTRTWIELLFMSFRMANAAYYVVDHHYKLQSRKRSSIVSRLTTVPLTYGLCMCAPFYDLKWG